MEINGIAMADCCPQRSKPGVEDAIIEERNDAANPRETHYCPDGPESHHAFDHVKADHENANPFAEDATRVGASRIMRAVIPRILMKENFADDDAVGNPA